MAPTHNQMDGTTAEAYRLSIVASERLRTALQQHGLDLAGLRGAHPSGSGEPVVEWGRSSATVAHALAALLERIPPATGQVTG